MKRFSIISLAVLALTASACKPPTEPKAPVEDDCDDAPRGFSSIIE